MMNEGEKIAKDFLASKGYKILATNFHAGQFGEVDIICKDGNEIVFVEVKMRGSNDFGEPEEAVDARKLSKIRRVAEIFLAKNNLRDTLWRIDAVAIRGNEIEHIILE